MFILFLDLVLRVNFWWIRVISYSCFSHDQIARDISWGFYLFNQFLLFKVNVAIRYLFVVKVFWIVKGFVTVSVLGAYCCKSLKTHIFKICIFQFFNKFLIRYSFLVVSLSHSIKKAAHKSDKRLSFIYCNKRGSKLILKLRLFIQRLGVINLMRK